jgi:hypothetical protein
VVLLFHVIDFDFENNNFEVFERNSFILAQNPIYCMGILDRFKRKKKTDPKAGGSQVMPPPGAGMPPGATYQRSAASGAVRAEMDLILSQMETLRIQYEAINTRLQNIERLVTEIRSFCK